MVFLCIVFICASGYCDDKPVLSAPQISNNNYEKSVPALSAADTTARTNAVEAVVTNKNAMNPAAQSIANLNSTPSTILDTINVTGDIVLNQPLVVPAGQTLTVNGTLTVNSGGSVQTLFNGNNPGSTTINDTIYTITASDMHPATGLPIPISGTLNSATLITIPGGNIIQGSGSTISITGTQTTSSTINATNYGTITPPPAEITIVSSGSIAVSGVAKDDNPKIKNEAQKEMTVKLTRDMVEKHREALKDVLSGTDEENKDKEPK